MVHIKIHFTIYNIKNEKRNHLLRSIMFYAERIIIIMIITVDIYITRNYITKMSNVLKYAREKR